MGHLPGEATKKREEEAAAKAEAQEKKELEEKKSEEARRKRELEEERIKRLRARLGGSLLGSDDSGSTLG